MILSTEKLPSEALGLLRRWRVEFPLNLDRDLKGIKVLIAWPNQLTDELLQRASNLGAIQSFSAGVEGLPLDRIPVSVKIFSNAGAYSVPVAEHAWAIVLALAKGVGRNEKIQPLQLRGKTLVVLGCGGIGVEVARIGKTAFGMRVIGVSRSFHRPAMFERRLGMNRLDEALKRADVIVCTLPVNRQTRNLLSYAKLILTKDSVIIVNVSRAEVFDENGLYKYLLERPSAKYGTDVFWLRDGIENFESKFWELKNFSGTPHTAGGYGSIQVKEQAIIIAARNVRRYCVTGNARNQVKREDYLPS